MPVTILDDITVIECATFVDEQSRKILREFGDDGDEGGALKLQGITQAMISEGH